MASSIVGSEDGTALTLNVTSLTPAEYHEGLCAVSALPVPAWPRYVQSILIYLSGATLGLYIAFNGVSPFIIPACFVAALVAFAIFRDRLVRRSSLASYLRNFPLEITIDRSGLRSLGGSSEVRYGWTWFDGWKDCKSVVVAYSIGSGLFVFPKRELAAQIEALKTLFDANIAK